MNRYLALKQDDKSLLERRKDGFDLSKFTVVGSPTITEDGVASGFSRGKYIKIQPLNLSNNFIINLPKFNLNSFTFVDSSGGIIGSKFSVRVVINANGQLNCSLSSDNISWNIMNGWIDGFNILLNKDYYARISYDGNVYKFEISENGTNYTTLKSVISSLLVYNPSEIYLGVGDVSDTRYNVLTDGSIDLKQFSITVDGKEIFTGAKESYYVMRR